MSGACASPSKPASTSRWPAPTPWSPSPSS
jgi:hypothetical protein